MAAQATGKSLTDCPSNLKEAIDWILRVTGKDGQDRRGYGDQAITDLTKKVKALLDGVSNDYAERGHYTEESEAAKKLMDWLSDHRNQSGIKTLIESLAGGLATFIGYNSQKSNGVIGTKGISVSNDPLERLRDGVLGFWLGVLGQIARLVKGNDVDRNTIDAVIIQLKGTLGSGSDGVRGVASAVASLGSTFQNNGVQGVTEILKALKDGISELQSKNSLESHDIKTLAGKVERYLEGALGMLAKDTSLTNITAQGNTVQDVQRRIRGQAQAQAQISSQAQDVPVQSLVNALKAQLVRLVRRFVDIDRNKPINLTRTGEHAIGAETMKVQTALKPLSNVVYRISKNATAQSLITALVAGTNGFIGQLQKPKYESSYNLQKNPEACWSIVANQNSQNTCAKIFMGCIPLYYHTVTHLYWQCIKSHDQGGWADHKLSGEGVRGSALKNFMFSSWYGPERLNGNTNGRHIAETALGGFKELRTVTKPGSSYHQLLAKLHQNLNEVLTASGISTAATALKDHSISALFLSASTYFKHCNRHNAQKSVAPSTIRETLYWMAGLTFSPNYEDLKQHIDGLSPAPGIPVAISGSQSSGETLSAEQIKDHLTISCNLAPGILGLIQGRGDLVNEESGPWLHSLFSNMEFSFSYPSGPALFYKLSEYTYAMQFQLHFLYKQCSNTPNNCGWQNCFYGHLFYPASSDTPVASHICHADCNNHRGSNCGHTHGRNSKCGKTASQGGYPSPLQAFLTDSLTGFCRKHPGTSNHLVNCSSGSICHSPMGFEGHLRNSGVGLLIYYGLMFFCGNSNTSLRQLSEKLACLSKRTPRTLGDLFGFIWHLNGQLFKMRPTLKGLTSSILVYLRTYRSIPATIIPSDRSSLLAEIEKMLHEFQSQSKTSSGHVKSLLALYKNFPFWSGLFLNDDSKELPGALFDVRQHCHQQVGNGGVMHKDYYASNADHKCNQNPADFMSLCSPGCSSGDNCGPYLTPLVYSTGSAFSPEFASTYLSWVLYLIDELQTWFQEMHVEFKNIECRAEFGCKESTSSPCYYPKGQHGSGTSSCSCDTIVQCGGVLPLLYRHGFHYYSTGGLDGWKYVYILHQMQ
ncbi:variant erythrocyte surface antigen-1 family protein [Babesia caballi]|uniref:Variant erythrocyte surface antigen-1 family protein n=1 Tax=Babesia caballi TaxID=5871 RepID=A0AAV4M465_BABCB|nr:variant erythrocyte surface antigen-1 family protein [Babesia caballi]